MEMTSETHTSEKELSEIHFDTLEWKSSLQFINGEILFISQLLDSYVFEPTTPNLFERLQEFIIEIQNIKDKAKRLQEEIKKHENELGGIMECDTISCDHYYYEGHELLKKHFNDFYKNFLILKSKVFRYAGGILKKNKK